MGRQRLLPRRATYRAGIWTADYFIVGHIRRFIEREIPKILRPESRVLDAGCGEQPFRRLIESTGGSYASVDIAQNAAGTVDVIAALTNIPLPSGTFDIIMATEVLEHLDDPAKAFAELARLLRPSGKLLLTVPFAYPLHEEPHDYQRFTLHGIIKVADLHAFSIDFLEPCGDEIEVIATVWTNLWSRVGSHWPPVLRRAWILLCAPFNVLGNGLATVVSLAMKPLLPRKSYLSNAAMLTKRSAS